LTDEASSEPPRSGCSSGAGSGVHRVLLYEARVPRRRHSGRHSDCRRGAGRGGHRRELPDDRGRDGPIRRVELRSERHGSCHADHQVRLEPMACAPCGAGVRRRNRRGKRAGDALRPHSIVHHDSGRHDVLEGDRALSVAGLADQYLRGRASAQVARRGQGLVDSPHLCGMVARHRAGLLSSAGKDGLRELGVRNRRQESRGARAGRARHQGQDDQLHHHRRAGSHVRLPAAGQNGLHVAGVGAGVVP